MSQTRLSHDHLLTARTYTWWGSYGHGHSISSALPDPCIGPYTNMRFEESCISYIHARINRSGSSGRRKPGCRQAVAATLAGRQQQRDLPIKHRKGLRVISAMRHSCAHKAMLTRRVHSASLSRQPPLRLVEKQTVPFGNNQAVLTCG
jgi:hypothetical protein